MNSGLMHGMLWAGLLLAAVPLLLGLAIGGFLLRRHVFDRGARAGDAAHD
ncbi:MAG TPA: hypothetical protein VF188_07250 [Longimicrobiales bacterium]